MCDSCERIVLPPRVETHRLRTVVLRGHSLHSSISTVLVKPILLFLVLCLLTELRQCLLDIVYVCTFVVSHSRFKVIMLRFFQDDINE